MPTIGIAPDAEFPLIHGEKGITTFDIQQTQLSSDDDEPEVELLSFISGERYNMVPDYAEANLLVKENMTDCIQQFEAYLSQHHLKGNHEVDSGVLKLTMEGKAVHGMDPSIGINAGLHLIHFINSLTLDLNAKNWASFSDRYFI